MSGASPGRKRRRQHLWRRWTEGGDEWATHLRSLPPEEGPRLLSKHPVLRRFPVTLARALLDCAPEDQTHLLSLGEHIVRGRLDRGGAEGTSRAPRVWRDVGRRLALLIRTWRRRAGGTTATCSFRALLPRNATPATLAAVVRTLATTAEAGRDWASFLHGAIDSGVFEPTVPAGTRLGWRRRPTEGWGRARARPVRSAVRATDVARLEAACRTDRERVVLALLSTTGLRREAVACLRVDDVWDSATAALRCDGLRAVEKFGAVRRLPAPLPVPLARALERYLRSPTESPLLTIPPAQLLLPAAPGPGRPAGAGRDHPCPSTVTSVVRALCVRAGIHPPFRPHQFRSYVVDEIVRGGGEVADAAAFLGHRSAAVTFAHYLSADLPAERIPMLTAPEATTTTVETWALLQEARLRLEAECRDLRNARPDGSRTATE